MSLKDGNQFIFVGRPAMTGKGDELRSKFIQEAKRKNRLQRRNNAMAEINKLLKDRTTVECRCRMAIVPRAPSQSLARKTGEPKIEAPVAHLVHCPFYNRHILSDGPLITGGSVHDLGSWIFDPMIPINERISKLRVREIVSFASKHIFPNIRSLDLPDLYRTWAIPFDDDELKLFTLLWSTKYHEGVLRLTYGAPEDSAGLKEQLTLKGLTLRALRKEVGSFTGQKPIDSIIRCIFVLAVNGSVSERIYREPSPFAPLFTGLHGIEVYGSRDYDPLHWKVMYQLLEKHGGIEALRLFALAWQVSVADLLHAAHTIRKPLYPMVDIYGQRLELDPPLVLFTPYGCGQNATSPKPGSGFNELLFMEPPVYQKHVAVFSHVGELSYVMDYMSTRPCDPRLLDVLADSRDLVHHRLFSLPNEHDTPDQILQLEVQSNSDTRERSMKIYLICRLAMLLYATHVTFPLPRPTVVRGRLLRSLCPRLQSIVGQDCSSPLLLWCTCLALIALDGTGASDELFVMFKNLCRNLQVTSLEKLLRILRSFAWVDSAVQHRYAKMKGFFMANHEDRRK